MPRALTFVAAWALAAGVAFAVAWQGVTLVGQQVTDRRPGALSAEEIQRELEEEAAASGTSSSVPSTSSTQVGEPSTSIADLGPDATVPASVPTTVAGRPAGPTTGATTPAPPPPAPPTTAAPAAVTRTYSLVGGSASLRFQPSGVTVVWATPNPGFEVEVEPEHGNGVQVEFRSDAHRSRVDGWWDGGPQDRVQEED